MSFPGICLTDTFQLHEADDQIARYLPDNSERRKRQKATDIRVIVGNPPYSVGQKSANDDNANVEYPTLNNRIRDTYVARSTATNRNSLYDSYIKAIRWASDRIGHAGVVAYVTNAGWVDGNAADGLRACLVEEFSDLYVFHLRGNARTAGERRKKEAGNVFDQGSRAPVAISIFVKNPEASEHGRVFFHDIGDYLDRQRKLAIIHDFSSIAGITASRGWNRIEPDDHNDWLNQRDESFGKFLKIADKKDKLKFVLFQNYSSGVKTNRDSWCYNSSKNSVIYNMKNMIDKYNFETGKFVAAFPSLPNRPAAEGFVDTDSKKIKWTSEIFDSARAGRLGEFYTSHVVPSMYRPYSAEWAYFDKHFNSRIYKMTKLFPYEFSQNLAIVVTGKGVQEFSALMINCLPNYDFLSKGVCIPLKLYESGAQKSDDLVSQDDGLRVRDGITDSGLTHFQAAYPGEAIAKEDIFYYVYGLLHSEDYRNRYAANLTKELPRIPCVRKAADFWAFSRAGRALGELHVNYESVEPYPVSIKQGDLRMTVIDDEQAFYRVEKMKFGGAAREKDRSTVIYNANITMQNIPLQAYEYTLNGTPALEWVMERQSVKTDKDSGITNDANRYAIETIGDPAYPLKLFQRVITVSLETMKIVRALPPLDLPE